MEPLELNLTLIVIILVGSNVASMAWALYQYRKFRKIRAKFLYPPQ